MAHTASICLITLACAIATAPAAWAGRSAGTFDTHDASTLGRVAATTAGVEDCSGVPGAIVHDDNTYEGGFGGYFEVVDTSEFVERFDPAVLPGTITDVCVAITNTGPGVSDFDFNVRVYADDGEDGGPGTLLGEIPAHIDQVPAYVFGAEGVFVSVDVSPLQLEIMQGSVYVGVEWNDMLYPGNFLSINSDAWSGGAFAGGYYRNTFTPWTSMYWAFLSSYRALQIRAIARAMQPTLAIDASPAIVEDLCVAGAGTGNGVAEPGEIVGFTISVLASAGDFSGVRVDLAPPVPPGIEYLDASAEIGLVDDGTRAEASLRVRLDGAATCIQDVHIPVAITSDQGSYLGEVRLPVGRAREAMVPIGMPRKIPNQDEGGLASAIDVPQSASIEALEVRVGLNHFTVSDLVLTLTSPAGTTITLLDRPGYPPFPGCENAVGDIHFVDGAPEPEHVCAEPAGGTPWPVVDASPVDPLSSFAGEDMRGTWVLTVIDQDANNAGALVGWSIHPVPELHDACMACGELPDRIFGDGFDGASP